MLEAMRKQNLMFHMSVLFQTVSYDKFKDYVHCLVSSTAQ